MDVRLLALVVSAALAVGSNARAEARSSQNSETAVRAYAHTEGDLREQFEDVARAYQNGDTQTGQILIARFRVPDPGSWLTELFGPEQGTALAVRYEKLFARYASFLEKTLSDLAGVKDAELVVTLEGGKLVAPTREPPFYKRSSMAPSKEINPDRVHFEIKVEGQTRGSWMDAFVYQDGAFRVVGAGTEPFWAWQEGAGPYRSAGGAMFHPPTPVRRTEPEYPPGAKAIGIQGVVRIKATIGKDGSVLNVKVSDGDPLLAQAAAEAVRHWEFKPATLGGMSVECVLTVEVNFRLGGR